MKDRQKGEVAAKTWEEACEHMELLQKAHGSSEAGDRFISSCISMALIARSRAAPPGSMARVVPPGSIPEEEGMKVWWMGWTFPDEHWCDKRVAAAFPKGVKGWISGYGNNYTTWCGRVEANSPEEAEELVLSMYGELAEHVRWRWEPEGHPKGWVPGDRFPM